MMGLFAVIVGALAERLRGGFPPLGAPGSDKGVGRARALRSLVFGALAYGLGAPWQVALLTAATIWVGVLNSHSACWKVQSASQLLDMIVLGWARGVFGLAPLFFYAGIGGHDVTVVLLVALPVAHAASYALAARLDARLPRWGGLLDNWNAYAELAWGGFLGVATIILVQGG